MIIQTGNVMTVAEWAMREERILFGMRAQIENTAKRRDLVLGNEVIEKVFMRFNELTGAWVGVGDNWDSATHVKVTIEVQAEHA